MALSFTVHHGKTEGKRIESTIVKTSLSIPAHHEASMLLLPSDLLYDSTALSFSTNPLKTIPNVECVHFLPSKMADALFLMI